VLLRPYQSAAIDGLRAELRRGARRVLLTCPTGGGKTVVAAEIIRAAVAKGSRVLFLAHRRELIHQTCDKLRHFGVPHGIIMAGEPEALQQPVQVASVQSLARRTDRLPPADLLFFDEAHHAAAGSYTDVLSWYSRALVVGLTATPWRLDGKGLADVFDGHVLARTPRELRDEGYLAPVGGWEYEAIDTEGARVKGGDFVAADLSKATTRRVIGDVVEEWKRHAGSKRTVVFAVSIAASQQLRDAFLAAGVAAEHVDGEQPTVERDAVVARLREGRTLVVCNCNVLAEGFDCPELEVCVLARPTLSTALYLQMVGRVLRPAEGKERARIHDHAGCLKAHGHPYAARDYSPATAANVERSAVEKAKGPPARCPACKSVHSGRWPCDACGYHPTPADLQVQVVEAARAKAILDSAEWQAARATQAKRDGLAARFRVLSEGERYDFWLRMVAKHGPRRAIGVYRWWSGETAWPDRAWRSEGAA